MKTILAVVLFGLLAGCAAPTPEGSAGSGRSIANGDDFKIEAAVYGYLLDKKPWGHSDINAVYLQADDRRAAALIKAMPRVPLRLEPASRMPAAGKAALLLTAKALDPTNGVSEAVGTWRVATNSGLVAFVLVEVGETWTIESAK